MERLRLIELNLQQNATLLLDSELKVGKKDPQVMGDQYIEGIIGDDKINIIVAIYSIDGSLIYKNDNAEIFKTPTALEAKYSEWEDVELNEYFIKYLTREDKHQGRIIKVGMVLNQSLLRWKYLSQRVFVFAGIILIFITIITYLLTTFLFRPINELAKHVNALAESLDSGSTDEFKSIYHISSHRFNDEFSALLNSINKLSVKITETHNITKKWSAMMAHELKTPLTILKNKVESLSLQKGIDPAIFQHVDEEMIRMENIIEDFLQWASFENDPSRPEIHAVSIRKRADYIVGSLKENFSGSSIELLYKFKEELKVFCNPIHFDQLLSNLVVNAIKYGEGNIKVECHDNYLLVSDEGPGIPGDVLSRLGSPFNHARMNGQKGCGLGLAWVNTICRKYGWRVSISESATNSIYVYFNNEISE